jgi:hypothetical protein
MIRLRRAARHVELVAMVAAALLLATVGALLGAVAGDDETPPTKPSPRR